MRLELIAILLFGAACALDDWDDDWVDSMVWISPANQSSPFETGNQSWPLIENQSLDFFQTEDDMSAFWDWLAGNQTDTGPWTVVSFVTLLPLRCAEIANISARFDDAVRRSNPSSDITSRPRRLEGAMCAEGICPCADSYPYAVRTLELESTSTSRRLAAPLFDHFPYQFTSHGMVGLT